MDRMRIIGGTPINGKINISGAKNAALPLMICAILTEKPITLHNIPQLSDIQLLQRILNNHGVDVMIHGKKNQNKQQYHGNTIRIHAKNITDVIAPYALLSKMRAGFWIIGPLLARCKKAKISLPGGCAIGTRPVNFYLDALKKMGAQISIDKGYVNARAPKGLKGAHIYLPKVSVGATHTIMMAATNAKGITQINNAAREPEIVNVAQCLKKMGADIKGEGTPSITINGKTKLNGAEHITIPDRIETATYMIAALITNGKIKLQNTNPQTLQTPINILKQTGANIKIQKLKNNTQITCQANNEINPVNIETNPYPGFPTDLQAQLMALMCVANGNATIRETIFENRFIHIQELTRMGASINLLNDTAYITGNKKLNGAQVMATDLRASVSLILAALAAKGETIVNRIYHLDRGFENLEGKLEKCGANIERLTN